MKPEKRKIYIKKMIIIELIVLCIAIIGSIIMNNIYNLELFCTGITEALGNLYDAFLASIGIYIAIITFLASSKTPFSEKIKNNNLFDKLGNYILSGIINNLIIIFSNIFLIDSLGLNKKIYVLVPIAIIALFSIIYFIGFVIISYSIYKYNIEQLFIDSEKEAREKDLLITDLDHIDSLLNEINKKIK